MGEFIIVDSLGVNGAEVRSKNRLRSGIRSPRSALVNQAFVVQLFLLHADESSPKRLPAQDQRYYWFRRRTAGTCWDGQPVRYPGHCPRKTAAECSQQTTAR